MPLRIISKSPETERKSLIIGIKNQPTTQDVLRYMVASSSARPVNAQYRAMMYPAPLCRKGFRAFPPEIRQMIFREVLPWNGKTPALLKALRGDKLLYKEALHLFFQLNSYNLSCKNGWSFGDSAEMKTKTIKTVRSLNVHIAEFVSATLCQNFRKIYNKTAIKSMRFHTLSFPAAGLYDIERYYRRTSSRHECICNLLKAILPHVTELRKVVVVCRLAYDPDLQKNRLLIEELNNEVFHKQGKLETVSTTGHLTWFWELEAKKG